MKRVRIAVSYDGKIHEFVVFREKAECDENALREDFLRRSQVHVYLTESDD